MCVVLVVSVLGCGGDDGDAAGTPSSCDLTEDIGYCLDFGAEAPGGIAQSNCDGANTTLGYNGIVMEDGMCPVTDRVGTCVATISGVVTTYRYYPPKWDTAGAQENCDDLSGTGGAGGTFTPN